MDSRATIRPRRFSRASVTSECTSRFNPSRNVMSSKSCSSARRRPAASRVSVWSATNRPTGLSISRAPRRRIWSKVTERAPTSTGRRTRGAVLSHAKELKELDPLAEAAPHNGRALDHLPHDLGDLPRAEEEGAVKLLLHLEDVSVGDVSIKKRGDLEAILCDELPRLVAQPALALGLVVQVGPGQRGRERHLDGVWIDLLYELDRLADRFLRLAGETDDEGAVHLDSQRVTVRGELSGPLDLHPFLDVVEDLLAAGFEPDGEQPQAVLLEGLQGVEWHVYLGGGAPGHALRDQHLPQPPSQVLHPRPSVGQGVVVEEDLSDLWKVLGRSLHLADDILRTAHTVGVPAHRVGPQTERTARATSPTGIEGDEGIERFADLVVLDAQVAPVHIDDPRQRFHIRERTVASVNDLAAWHAVAEPVDLLERMPLAHFLAREVEFEAGDEVDCLRGLQRLLWQDGDVWADEAHHQLRVDIFHRLGGFDVGAEGGGARMDEAQLELLRLLQHCVERHVRRRRIDELTIRHQGGRLGEPGRVPERANFATSLVS